MFRDEFTVQKTPTQSSVALSVNPELRDYSPNLAYLSAFLASWSYSESHTFRAQLAKFGLGNWTVKLLAEDCDAMAINAHGGIVTSPNGKLAFLFFRGTAPMNAASWLTNTDVHHMPYRQCGRIHEGFYRNLEAIWPDMLAYLRAEKDLEAVVVSGHSLGGAMAALVAMEVWYDPQVAFLRNKLVGAYTFGQPMLTTPDLAKKCNDDGLGARLFRHVYLRDLVPRLPPWSMGRLAHFGREFVNDGQRWNERSRFVSQTLSLGVSLGIGATAFVLEKVPILGRLQLPFNLDDHFPYHYLYCSRPDGSAAHPGTPTDGSHRLIGGALPLELEGGDGLRFPAPSTN
jgi:hypothetical protein